MKQNIAVAIDGPAAAGKSTVAKIIAEKLTYVYIDTGAMYRALTYKAIKEGVSLEEERSLMNLLKDTTIDLQQSVEGQKVILDGEEVTLDIRTEQVTNQVSIVAKHGEVRHEMVKRQRELALKRGVVMDGRDIGTHVIPDAEVKIFLIASVQERAERRHKENLEKGFSSDLEKLKDEIRRRDKIDSEREVSPLLKAEDAVEIDTTSLSIIEVAEKILRVVHDKLDRGE
ncbi:cytidylate kinase [Pontibacillus chungwhensis BH030062]|uniref:Cytidylate kinase n=1 Tax=Pontibacillus chungwhensis BH030062 TaxID=1385513 RepID=A0A0A2UYZ0_9BACI|nr:(d)CMP kinase [Pontibacillus chungwhensis]KGP93149.1 cytidylate kinase [Pontibacillus chungwhensis BH030062]